MMEVELSNVTEAIANLTERGAVDPVVKATIMLSDSGFVSVTDAVAFGEIKDDSLKGQFPPISKCYYFFMVFISRKIEGFVRWFLVIRGR